MTTQIYAREKKRRKKQNMNSKGAESDLSGNENNERDLFIIACILLLHVLHLIIYINIPYSHYKTWTIKAIGVPNASA